MIDVLVIGAGPAGISAGIYAKRAGAKVTIFFHGTSNLQRATEIQNYYGFENGISGDALYKTGIRQAKNLGIDVLEEEVLNIEKDNNTFIVETTNCKYSTKTVIIATGNKKLRPNIDGILEFEGKGISYCAICDGFFYRKNDVAVIGNGKFAISEANHLKNIVNKVTILTNGCKMQYDCDFDINQKKIKKICGTERVSSIEFYDGSKLNLSGIFIAIGEAGGSDFAKKMGILLNGNNIITDENMKTNIDGLYACGDSTGDLLQVCKATYEGAKAGISATNYIKNIKEVFYEHANNNNRKF